MLLVDGGSRLLDLQEQWISPVATLQQDEEHPHADASDADDLPDRIAEPESVQEMTSVLRECLPVAGEDLDHECQFVRGEMDSAWRILGDPQVTVHGRR